ncbi:MAG: TauD/TfdA family dioxygenase [Ilumatobacter sp.]|nr:TauD/TfdA family dioxygenase [Ilumatobacter sp.]
MQAHPLYSGRSLPLLAETGDAADAGAAAGAAWAHANRDAIEAGVQRAGAVLIRGFEITSATEFRAVCAAIRPDLRNYTGGDSPRTGLADQVYTSTEYPAHLEVFLHNELSYAGWSPDRLFFCCLTPSETGGETPVADGREVYARLDPAIRDRFETRGVTYLQHLWDADDRPGVGKSWQDTFETGDRAAVETYLREAGMDFEWTGLGLRTAATHPAVLEHALTGETCWHNQADQWHREVASVKVAFGGVDDPRIDPHTAGVETLGNHVTYEDGSPIDVADLLHVRTVARSCEAVFPWQPGDVMVIDNVLAMHGRKPFTGHRRVLAAMA